MPQMSEIQYADPAARRRALWLVIFLLSIGGLTVFASVRYLPWIERWLLSNPDELEQRVAAAAALVFAAINLPLVAFAAHLWVRGTYVHRYQRFPVRGEHVVRDTPVVRGEEAVLRGRLFQSLAVALVAAAILLAVVLLRVATAVAASA